MKKCFKCNQEFPLSEFYRHPKMGDGYLGKCKTCTKADSEARRLDKMKDPEWVEAEIERHRLKQARYRKDGIAKTPTLDQKREAGLRHAAKYPEKTKARNILSNAIRDGKVFRKPCEQCGSTDSEGHHDDYSKPLDVVWLCPKHHAERHRELRKQMRAMVLVLEE